MDLTPLIKPHFKPTLWQKVDLLAELGGASHPPPATGLVIVVVVVVFIHLHDMICKSGAWWSF